MKRLLLLIVTSILLTGSSVNKNNSRLIELKSHPVTKTVNPAKNTRTAKVFILTFLKKRNDEP